MPVLQEAVALGRDKHILCLLLGRGGSPSQSSDWHIVALPVLIDMAAESKGTLARVHVVNSDGSITETASEILVGWVKSTAENFRVGISKCHFVGKSSLGTLLVKDPLTFLWRFASIMSNLLEGGWEL